MYKISSEEISDTRNGCVLPKRVDNRNNSVNVRDDGLKRL